MTRILRLAWILGVSGKPCLHYSSRCERSYWVPHATEHLEGDMYNPEKRFRTHRETTPSHCVRPVRMATQFMTCWCRTGCGLGIVETIVEAHEPDSPITA
ncbi:hypothetical protein EDD16DRAFT_1576294 [Pisolithus croceorrhizus]|nr:hypothetical protein EDD16DRAFT_1576294 [Pisolithus croceorrhizus]